jgi:predicted oxidoreductase
MRLAEWGLTARELLGLVERCLDLGLTTFDHADIYGGYTCEARFGEALALAPGLRQRMQLVTKCGIKLVSANRPAHQRHIYDTGRAHILASAEASLRQLRVDDLDVLLIHRPDPLMDADEIAEAFASLRQAGKVRHFGVSNFTPDQFELLRERLPFPLVTNQIEASVLRLEPFLDGTLDQAQRLRCAPLAWSPLAGGRLFAGGEPRAERVRAALEEVGRQLGEAALDQVALAWLLRHPARIVPVLGTGKIERLAAAVAALELQLTREQWFAVWTASAGADIP